MLKIVKFGYKLELLEPPPLGLLKTTTSNPVLEDEVRVLLQKKAIQQVPPQDSSGVFTPVISPSQRKEEDFVPY